jgi:hypothetical protein
MAAHVPRFKARVLTVFLLIGLPILVIGIGIALAIGQSRLSVSYGNHLQEIAQQTAAAVDTYFYRRMLDVSLLARSPELRREAQAASSRPQNLEAARAIEAEWSRQREVPAAVQGVLTNPAAMYLADIVAHDTIYKEMLLTDRFGRLIAASNKPSNYYQADEDWWRAAVEDGGRGRVTMSDVRWDDSAKVHAIEIAVPVTDATGQTLAGVLKVVTDSREMLATVGGVQLGATGDAVLLRDNGSIVFSRRSVEPNARFFAAAPLQARMQEIKQGGPEHGASFRATTPDGAAWVVGIASSQLGRSFPNVSWVVAVTQSEAELLAPVRAVGWYLFAVFALVTVAVLVLALYMSMRLAAPQVEEDLHLVEHAAVAHVGDAEPEPEAKGMVSHVR